MGRRRKTTVNFENLAGDFDDFCDAWIFEQKDLDPAYRKLAETVSKALEQAGDIQTTIDEIAQNISGYAQDIESQANDLENAFEIDE